MDEYESARAEFLELCENLTSAQLATLSSEGLPEASYAPCVRIDGEIYLYLSELASHTRNLQQNPVISLLLLEPESGRGNAFARKRISLQGKVEVVGRDSPLFARVMAEFHQRFGQVVELIEGLPDFHLFRVTARQGRFVRGFAQAFELGGDRLDQLNHIDPRT